MSANKFAAIVDAKQITELGYLVDPKNFCEPIELEEFAQDQLLHGLELMLLIRSVEESIAELVVAGDARCPCHLGIGQEAAAVGVALALDTTRDKSFGAHRSHSHYLALGGDLDGLLAEVLGKVTGCSRGMGGSMHLFSPAVGFLGSVPIVGATIPIAVGAGLAAKMEQNGAIAVSFFGDGATEEGVFHESLNLAAAHHLPVLFVCENNLQSSHLDIALRQPSDTTSRFAVAHRIPALVVDGNDLVSMIKATRTLVSNIRAGNGPAYIEAVTYRWRGHVGPDENIDVGLRRDAQTVDAWKKRDPIRRLDLALQRAGVSEDKLKAIGCAVRTRVESAVARAKAAEYPADQQLFSTVWGQAV